MKWFRHTRDNKKRAQVYSVWLVAMKLMRLPFFLHSISRFCIQTTKSVWIEWNTGHRRQTTTAYWMSIHNVNVDCAYAQQIFFSIQCNQDTVWPFVQFVNGIKSAFFSPCFSLNLCQRVIYWFKRIECSREREISIPFWPMRVRCDSISKKTFSTNTFKQIRMEGNIQASNAHSIRWHLHTKFRLEIYRAICHNHNIQ